MRSSRPRTLPIDLLHIAPVGFALAGVAWAALTGVVVFASHPATAAQSALATAACGGFFVVASAIGFRFAMRRALWLQARGRSDQVAAASQGSWKPLWILVATGALIGATSYGLYRQQVAQAKLDRTVTLELATRLQARRVESWFEVRTMSLRDLSASPYVADELQEMSAGEGLERARRLRRRLDLLVSGRRFSGLAVLRPDGQRLAAVGRPITVSPDVVDVLRRAVGASDVRYTDIYEPPEAPDTRVLDFAIPVFAVGARRTTPVALLIARVDVDSSLLPLLRQGGDAYATMETALLRKDAGRVAVLSPLGEGDLGRTGNALGDPGRSWLGGRLTDGEQGAIEAIDYRGVPTLGMARPVAGTPWLMAAKVDLTEINAPVVRIAALSGAMAAAALLAGGLMIGFWWRGERLKFELGAQEADERARELVRERDRAEKADQLKSAFLATMSHELRTPLNSILGFTDVMLNDMDGPLNVEQRQHLGIVRQSSKHLLALIDDVLDISRIEAGQLRLETVAFDVIGLLQRKLASFQPVAAARALRLELAVPADALMVCADPVRVEQIVGNLLSNAIKFTEHGSVTLAAQRRDGRVEVTVTDTGEGITAENLPQLFAPFRQFRSPLGRLREGTGLGLAISRNLALAMAGSLDASSVVGVGSRFRLLLPGDGLASRYRDASVE